MVANASLSEQQYRQIQRHINECWTDVSARPNKFVVSGNMAKNRVGRSDFVF